ncbi:hypothetical protein ACVWZ6_001799 [Bradyrhizobium sp. GM6.1]
MSSGNAKPSLKALPVIRTSGPEAGRAAALRA